MIDALKKINQHYGKTVVMVTHDPQMASHCDRILLLKDGEILDEVKRKGKREEFYREIAGKMAEL